MRDLRSETSPEASAKRMMETKMHDYKGFTVEPITGGFNIVIYGRKNILYVAGPGGWRMTDDVRQARAFRDPKTCHNLIDEITKDWQGWIDSTKGAKPVVNLEAQQQQKQTPPEHVRQQQQQGDGIVL